MEIEQESVELKFEWNSEDQGLVLAAFFYGYCVTQVVGGWLADKYRNSWK